MKHTEKVNEGCVAELWKFSDKLSLTCKFDHLTCTLLTNPSLTLLPSMSQACEQLETSFLLY